MKILEMYQNMTITIEKSEVSSKLLALRSEMEKSIEDIKEKINKFEQKKIAEENMYQSMSPLKRFFTGRSPSHHQAVEYMVQVKERTKRIEAIKNEIRELDFFINQLNLETTTELVLPTEIFEEIKTTHISKESKK